MDLLADFLHFGTSVFLLHVGLEQCEVWGVKSAVWSVKCEGSSGKWEVWSVECEVWSVKFKFGVRRAQCEVWSVRFGVWRKQWEVRSVECEVWSVECEVWSLECEECSVECRGKDTVGTGCLWTIGHLCLGNFRRRLARVYVILPDGQKLCQNAASGWGTLQESNWMCFFLQLWPFTSCKYL